MSQDISTVLQTSVNLFGAWPTTTLPPPKKKRRKLARTNPSIKTTRSTAAQLKVRLTNVGVEKFGLDDSMLLEIDEVEWIKFN